MKGCINLRVEDMRPARTATNLPGVFPPRTAMDRVALHALVNRWSESRNAEPRRADLGGLEKPGRTSDNGEVPAIQNLRGADTKAKMWRDATRVRSLEGGEKKKTRKAWPQGSRNGTGEGKKKRRKGRPQQNLVRVLGTLGQAEKDE